MGKDSKISWTDDTFNPWIGCTEVSPGCDNCYARTQDARYKWGGVTHWGSKVPRKRTSTSTWAQPPKWNLEAAASSWQGVSGKRRLVFCSSLADVFDNEVPERWRSDLLDLVDKTPNLTWLFLTKRIGNAEKMLSGIIYPNVWIGASVVNQEEADRDIPKLLDTPAAKLFISYEPALGPVDFSKHLARVHYGDNTIPLLSWIIVGGESGSNRRELSMDAARGVIAQCKAAGVPVFVKQDSAFLPGQQGRFTDEEFAIKEFPA